MNRVVVPCALFLSTATFGSAASAATIQNFDVAGSAYTLGGAGSVQALGGSNAARLTDAAGGGNGQLSFNTTDNYNTNSVVAQFSFIATPANAGSQADGIGFALANTATSGNTGVIANFNEEANLAGSLGVGIDIYNNGTSATEPDNNHISLHFNNAFVAVFSPTFDFSDGNSHTLVLNADMLNARATVTLDGTPVFTNLAVPGLTPYTSRPAFVARIGGQTATQSIDNVNVQYTQVPEPASLGLIAVAGLGLLARRRRAC